ncbi:MAG: MFS transporter, partial [Nitrospiria bacterium]
FVLILSDYIKWSGAYIAAAVILCVSGIICLNAPKEKIVARDKSISLLGEMKALLLRPRASGMVVFFLLGTLWLINNATQWSEKTSYFWWISFGIAGLLMGTSIGMGSMVPSSGKGGNPSKITEGPMFGALIEMLQRPYFVPVILFILTFKLADSSMGFMVKPFWVDSGFTATEIGLVSVNLGLILSISGGVVGGWITDRTDIFKSLWTLGLFQAISNLGYALSAYVLPALDAGAAIPMKHKALIYSASALESFTGGLGTAAFLAFLMAIVNKKHSATEYALLSSVFALSRSFAGWAGGFGAQFLGYGPYFLLTFFLAFPAYCFLPWVKKMLHYAESAFPLSDREGA